MPSDDRRFPPRTRTRSWSSRRTPRSSPRPTSRRSRRLAWTDRPAISFQFHPEFSPDFAKALIAERYDLVPDPDAAIASLDAPNDNARVGGWIRRFLWAKRPTEPGGPIMKTRAAVAFAAKQPLEIVEVDLDGPEGRAKCWSRSWRPASATPTPTRSTGSTAKASSPRSSAMRARAWCARSGRASPA